MIFSTLELPFWHIFLFQFCENHFSRLHLLHIRRQKYGTVFQFLYCLPLQNYDSDSVATLVMTETSSSIDLDPEKRTYCAESLLWMSSFLFLLALCCFLSDFPALLVFVIPTSLSPLGFSVPSPHFLLLPFPTSYVPTFGSLFLCNHTLASFITAVLFRRLWLDLSNTDSLKWFSVPVLPTVIAVQWFLYSRFQTLYTMLENFKYWHYIHSI